MLLLNEKDILACMSMKEAIDSIDLAYKIYGQNNFLMPTRQKVSTGDNTLILMPSITENVMGTKLVTAFPNNEEDPTLHGLVVLASNHNGKMLSIMDGSFITGFRTGAIGGSAARHLAPQHASKLAVIGTGVQGFYQTIAVCTEREITDIYLYNRTEKKVQSFIEKLQKELGDSVRFHIKKTTKETIEQAEIIITATTSTTPVLPDEKDLLKGKLIIGIGSFLPQMREFPQALFEVADHLYVDSHDAIKESGDVIYPLENNLFEKENIKLFSSIFEQEDAFNHDYNEGSVVFKSTGMALFDVVIAEEIYKRATEAKIGTHFSF